MVNELWEKRNKKHDELWVGHLKGDPCRHKDPFCVMDMDCAFSLLAKSKLNGFARYKRIPK